jgi:D-hexose-6-phosphate mutarotase
MNPTPSTTASVSPGTGQGGLARHDILTPFSRAEIYPHGAHLTHFQRHSEPPLLFLSEASRFDSAHPIRGGVPVVFPWFGLREGLPQHGYARISEWTLLEAGFSEAGELRLDYTLPWSEARGDLPLAVRYSIWIGRGLDFEFHVTNQSPRDALKFEACLHTYFAVGDIAKIHLEGLTGGRYLDSTANRAERTDAAPILTVGEEVDRLYVGHTAPVEIHDPVLQRRIRVTKEGSRSTVVWNPWIAKARRMPDFGDEEYLRMVCVESGNAGPDEITLPPAGSHTMRVRVESLPL